MQHIPACGSLRNLLLTISYDGKEFHGWQIQQNAMTVQEAFQTALSKIIGNDFDVKGCSRTDSGVHANMYCISLKTEHPIKPERLKAALNRWLPLSIAVLDCKEVAPDFHARYSCTSKEYIYKIWNSEVRNPFLDGYALHYRYKIDENLLDKAAQAYVGRHDFTSFCTLDNREKGDMTRNVKAFSVTREGDLVTMKVEADGFLYNMVRAITGTVLYAAEGKLTPEEIPVILDSGTRTLAGPTAPPGGLYLTRVWYEDERLNGPDGI